MDRDGDNPQADALDVLIEQERQLIDRFDARRANADATAAAAVTGALALAALTATAAQTIKHIDKTFAWVVVGALALVCMAALCARFLAGLHRSHLGLTSRSPRYKASLQHLRECGPEGDLDPVEVRLRALRVCRDRARDAEEAAESKERWGALVSLALGVSVLLTAGLALSLIGT